MTMTEREGWEMASPKRLAPKKPGLGSKLKNLPRPKLSLPKITLPQVDPGMTTAHRSRRVKGSPLVSAVSLPLMVLYHELLLRGFDGECSFFAPALLLLVVFSMAAGLAVFLLLDLIPHRKVARIVGGVLVAGWTVFTCVEYCCKSFFKIYFGLGYMQGMAGQVVGDFSGTVVEVVLARIPFILLSLVPLAVYVWLCPVIFHEKGQRASVRGMLAVLMVVFQLVGVFAARVGGAKNYYTYDFSVNTSMPHFGLVTTLRLELSYAITGIPEVPLDQLLPDDPLPTATVAPTLDPTGTDAPVVPTGDNVLGIDFEGLAAGESDETLKALHQYFAAKKPTNKNEYTGYFQGKNLILITAEAFCPYVIDENLTPTLYKLANQGFIFENYYQPDWTQSTTGGEFAVMTGLIPTWIGGSNPSFRVSVNDDMAVALGWQFQKLGYQTLAYHNNTYTYYGRDETHPNLGYEYFGLGNGLVLKSNLWPCSDLEMMEATVDGYIQNYVKNGTPFHTYYMTVSGHCNYDWTGNAMSRKNQETIQKLYPNASEQVQAYLACNLELEYAMAYLVEQLAAAGIADDTVIALSADHYPYALVEGDKDYYNELAGTNNSERDTARYRNTFILWSGCMEEPVVVDTPCSAIDIVPTLSNLFGLEYDSRLYSGRDIFATNYQPGQYSSNIPLVVFANKGYGSSWITDAGTYEASTKTFTPREGVAVDEDYVSRVSRLVNAKYTYAKLVIERDYYALVWPD
ncbi:hypothetical protein B5G37_06635 [Pseudoflavonifractor sp. An85]|nr:hypothetical protein B5G37_06635 [Pseudoflavonifractor sp. An85]